MEKNDSALLLDSKRLGLIAELTETGLIKPVVDRSYQFEEIVEANKYVEKGHKKGGVAMKLLS